MIVLSSALKELFFIFKIGKLFVDKKKNDFIQIGQVLYDRF